MCLEVYVRKRSLQAKSYCEERVRQVLGRRVFITVAARNFSRRFATKQVPFPVENGKLTDAPLMFRLIPRCFKRKGEKARIVQQEREAGSAWPQDVGPHAAVCRSGLPVPCGRRMLDPEAGDFDTTAFLRTGRENGRRFS